MLDALRDALLFFLSVAIVLVVLWRHIRMTDDEFAVGLIKDATRKAIILWIQKRALSLYHRWVKEKDRLNNIAKEEGFSSLADEELGIGHIVSIYEN